MDHKKSMKIGLICIVFCLMGFNLVVLAAANDNGVCYWDWKWYETSHIGDNKAPVGSEYIVATLYLRNIGDQKITTSANGWNLIADGLKYEQDTNTFNSSLGSQNIEIVEGGDIEIKIVYLVKGHVTHAQLQYDGAWGKGLSVAKVNYYGNQSGL